jgi:hypothetical protein
MESCPRNSRTGRDVLPRDPGRHVSKLRFSASTHSAPSPRADIAYARPWSAVRRRIARERVPAGWRHILIPTLLAFGAALALGSCNNDKIEVYSIPKEVVTVAMQSGSTGLQPPPPANPAKWVKPEGWNEQPLSEMRLGSFKVDGPNATSADVSVTAFPGDAGGLAPNINRWRSQLQLPALAEDQLQQSIQRIEVEGVPTYLVDIQTPENAPRPSRILGAVLDTSDRVWFIKMTGSPDLIESQREKFIDFVKSFRFTPVTDGQAPETGSVDKPKSTNDK